MSHTLSRAPSPLLVFIALAYNSVFLHVRLEIPLVSTFCLYCGVWRLVCFFTPVTRYQYHWTVALVSVLVLFPYRQVIRSSRVPIRDLELGIIDLPSGQDSGRANLDEGRIWDAASRRRFLDRIVALVRIWFWGTSLMEYFSLIRG